MNPWTSEKTSAPFGEPQQLLVEKIRLVDTRILALVPKSCAKKCSKANSGTKIGEMISNYKSAFFSGDVILLVKKKD